ncbi:MAG: ribokinase [candidate division WS1 bacterium]|nr:ribokinase [candidate division WS1 bacterium]
MAAKITVLGNINIDFVMRAERMPRPGETLMGSDLKLVPGGKCANQAVTAARVGADVTVIGRLGEDVFGPQLLANLEREGINTRYITTDPTTHTGSAFIALTPSGENSILSCMGANLAVTPEQVEGASEAIERADMLLVQLGVPLEAVQRAMEIAGGTGTSVLFDPTPVRGDLSAMWPLTTVSCPNETEAEVIIGRPATTIEDAAKAAEWFRDQGVDVAIIKLGARGALVLDDDGARVVGGYQVDVVDTTGAGDAFAGALGTRLAEGAAVEEAIAFANAAGAMAASRFGAQPSLPTRDEVGALMAAQQADDRVQRA